MLLNTIKLTRRLFILGHIFKILMCTVFVVLSCTKAVLAQDKPSNHMSAQQWLMKMQKAAIEENYIGTFILMRKGTTSSLSIAHRYKNGIEQERLKQLDGEMGEIIRNGDVVMCIFPGNRVVQVEKAPYANKIVQAFPKTLFGNRQYSLNLSGQNRMVDRASIMLDVTAKDADRYSYRLWIDEETSLLLKSAVLNDKGVELESFQFTDISFPKEISDDQLESTMPGGLKKHELIPVENVDVDWPTDIKWLAEWMPNGYQEIKNGHLNGGNTKSYSDGLASYSIFIEKVDDKHALPEGGTQIGATVAYSHQQKLSENKYNVTVIGEIPAITAMKIAKSVRPR